MSSPPSNNGGALHALGDAIGAAVAGVAGTIGNTVGAAVVAANKATETVAHALPGAGTGLTADEYVQQAPDEHTAGEHGAEAELKQSEKEALDALHADKARNSSSTMPPLCHPPLQTGVAIARGEGLSAPVYGHAKVESDAVPDNAMPQVATAEVAAEDPLTEDQAAEQKSLSKTGLVGWPLFWSSNCFTMHAGPGCC